MHPGPGGLSFSIYSLPVSTFDPDEIHFDLDIAEPVGNRLWLGTADYGRDRWQFFAGTDDMTSVAVSGDCLHTPEGWCRFLVIALDELTVQINSVSITLDLPAWNIQTIDDSDAPGHYSGMALVDGMPVIAYSAWDTQEVRLARSTVPIPDAPGDWERSIITGGFHTGRIDLRLINGLPAAGFVNQSTMMLCYARALIATPAGPADWVVMPLTTVAQISQFSLAEVDGRPAFVYVCEGMGGEDRIDYAIATIPAPDDATDWDPGRAVAETTAPHHLEWVSLLHPAETPAFTYYDTSSDRLVYQCSDLAAPQLTADWEHCLVDDDSDAGGWSSLAACGGQPAVAYVNHTDNTLRLATAETWHPVTTADWQVHCADPVHYTFGNLGVEAIGGGLGLAYHAPNILEELRFAWCSALPSATGDWSIVVVDENLGVGSANPLVKLANGQPAIAYMDVNNGMLRFATMIPE